MRVLWLTHTPSGASDHLKVTDPGRGWIGSLEGLIKDQDDITLGIAFFNDKQKDKFVIGKTTYFPIAFKHQGALGKLYQRVFSDLYDTNVDQVLAVIADFKPDVIHLFGTESGIGDVYDFVEIPIVVHLQGLVKPYLYNWFPKGISQKNIYFSSSWRARILRRGTYFEYKLFQKRAEREARIINGTKYFFGRTSWDKNYLELYGKGAGYIHCEEVLRPSFYQNVWQKPNHNFYKLVTTINPQIYKGFEIILETARLLSGIKDFAFEWHIIGIEQQNEIVSMMEAITNLKYKNFNVIFRGPKTELELVKELLSADVFIHPSHIDNSPNSVCEAMLLGMPVIASYVGGIPSLIEDRHNGVLYNSNDPYELASKILLTVKDKELIAELSKNARATGIDRHDHEQIRSTVLATYNRIIQKDKLKTA